MEADRALGVAGSVQDLGRVAVEANDLAVGEAFVGRGGFGCVNAEPGCLSSHHLQQRQVVFVEENGSAGKALELERSTDVVNVGVCDENLLELEAEGCQAAVDAGDFVAGIDDDGLAGVLVAQDGAVALRAGRRERSRGSCAYCRARRSSV